MVVQFIKDDKIVHAYLGIEEMLINGDGEIFIVYDVGDKQPMNVTWYAKDYDQVLIGK